MKRRTVLVLAGGFAAPVAGCLGPTDEESPTPTDGGLIQSGAGEYPHDITVHNAFDREVTLTLTVDRGGAEIYRGTHAVDADTSGVVAGITRVSLPEGDRRLSFTATMPTDQSTQVEVTVTDCLGSVDFTIDTAGELRSTYSIC